MRWERSLNGDPVWHDTHYRHDFDGAFVGYDFLVKLLIFLVKVKAKFSYTRSLQIDDKRYGVAQFMRHSIGLLLCDAVAKNFGCYTLLSKNKISCIVYYLATV